MRRYACQNRKKTGNKSVLLNFIQYDIQFTEIRHKFMIPGGFPIQMPYHDPRFFFFLTNWRHRFPQIKFTIDYEYSGIISVMWRDSSEKTKQHGENKFTLFWIMLRCFSDRGGKGGSNEDSILFVSLDKLLIWVNITIGLLCLSFDENRFMVSVKEHPENGHFSLFGPRVWTLFRSKIFFVMKMKTIKII